MGKQKRLKRKANRQERRELRRAKRKEMVAAYEALPDLEREETLPPYQEGLEKFGLLLKLHWNMHNFYHLQAKELTGL